VLRLRPAVLNDRIVSCRLTRLVRPISAFAFKRRVAPAITRGESGQSPREHSLQALSLSLSLSLCLSLSLSVPPILALFLFASLCKTFDALTTEKYSDEKRRAVRGDLSPSEFYYPSINARRHGFLGRRCSAVKRRDLWRSRTVP